MLSLFNQTVSYSVIICRFVLANPPTPHPHMVASGLEEKSESIQITKQVEISIFLTKICIIEDTE